MVEAPLVVGPAAARAAAVTEGRPIPPVAVPRWDPAGAASGAAAHPLRSLPASESRAKGRVDRTAHGPAAGRPESWSFQGADSRGSVPGSRIGPLEVVGGIGGDGRDRDLLRWWRGIGGDRRDRDLLRWWCGIGGDGRDRDLLRWWRGIGGDGLDQDIVRRGRRRRWCRVRRSRRRRDDERHHAA